MRDLKFTTSVVVDYFSALDCSKSLAACLLFKYGEHAQLIDLTFNPFDYNSLQGARDALAAVSFLSKATFLSLDTDKKQLAIDKFLLCEQKCERINHVFETLSINGQHAAKLFLAKRKISQILGSFDPEEFVNSCNWGPGSTLSVKAHEATSTRKFEHKLDLTPSCYNFVSPWFNTVYPLWEPVYRIVEGNKVITVPKNAKIDRVICVEPSGNLWFQKGLGAMIRKRLAFCGIDLNDQGHNQRLSRIGSRFGNLATVDFSSASDTISSGLVLDLLPGNWLEVLTRLRSPRYIHNDSVFECEKFSSMGNGFTFELESLIFYALAVACAEEGGHDMKSISIFGDDLIIPTDLYASSRQFFEDCGFSFNEKKSFSQSYYRESCGKHYWDGADITPLFLKEDVEHEISQYKIANSIRRYANRCYSYGCDIRFFKSWDRIRRQLVSKSVKKPFLIPDDFGDGGLVSNFDEASPSIARHGHFGYVFSHWVDIPHKCTTDSPALRLTRYWVTKGSSIAFGITEYLPRRTRRRKKSCVAWVWRDLGPWF
jgi:hypothetical protein